MGSEANQEEKKPGMKEQEHQHKGILAFRLFKSNILGLEDKIYESWTLKHAMQFTKTSEAITDYVQINFNGREANL